MIAFLYGLLLGLVIGNFLAYIVDKIDEKNK